VCHRKGVAAAVWRPAVGAFEVVERGRQTFNGQGVWRGLATSSSSSRVSFTNKTGENASNGSNLLLNMLSNVTTGSNTQSNTVSGWPP
jgi:hypothetical protein